MQTDEEARRGSVLNLRVGEIVEVRSASEIYATLDSGNELEALPFMPEMQQFCGRRFRVDKLAIKVCDTINATGMYRMEHAVHLEDVRCDGLDHGGCQAGCLIYWKEAWLKRVDANGAAAPDVESVPSRAEHVTRARECARPDDQAVYSCQATELMRAAPGYIPGWDLRQYILDVKAGNATTQTAIKSVGAWTVNKCQEYSLRYLPARLRVKGGGHFHS